MTEFIKRNVIVFVYFVLVLSTLLVFWQVRNFDFVNYDDKVYICENPHVLNGLTGNGVIWAFTTCYEGYWQPLTWLSLILNCQLFGPGPGWFHLVNVFLHLANTLLLFTVFRKMTAAIWQSAFVAALFALHPMHVESVAWISERKDVLSTLFWLLTMWAYVRYANNPPINWGAKFRNYGLALVFFALGLMSKPMLVTLPFVLLLLDYWPLKRLSIADCRLPIDISKNWKLEIGNWKFFWLLIEKIPFFVLAAVSSVVTFLTQKAGAVIFDTKIVPLMERAANVFLSYARYIDKLFVPRNLAVFYPYDAGSVVFWQVAMCLVLLIVISVLVIYFGRNKKYLPVGWFWFVGTLVPVIGLVTFTGSSYADRFTYIPYIGLFIMLAWGLPELLSGWPYRKIVLGVAASMTLLALGTVAYRQVGFWKDSITLFSHALEVTQNNAVVHNYLGNSYFDLKREQDAAEAFKQTIKIKPGYIEAYNNLGNACVSLGRFQEAAEAFKQAINIKPDFADAYNNLGNACLGLGRWQDAIENYKQAISIKPNWPQPYCNLGAAYGTIGSFQDALETYKQAVEIDPALAEAHNGFGAACLDLGRYQDAIEPLKRAISIVPNYADAHYNLGNAYSKLGRYQDAIEPFKQAISIKPDWAEAHYNLGVTYLITGDKDSAVQEYKILKTLGAEQADQLFNLIQR